MSGVTPVQSAAAYYGSAGSGGNLPCSYGSPNTANNIGVAWLTADTGSGPSGISDTQGNTWFYFQGTFTNGGYTTFWVCPNLKAGANTVTVGGVVAGTAPSTAPVLVLLELAPPASGLVGIQAIKGPLGINNGGIYGDGPPLTFEALFSSTQSPYYSTLLAFIKTAQGGDGVGAKSWSITTPGGSLASGVIITYTDTGLGITGAVAYCTVENSAENQITFSYSPSTPALPGDGTILIGLLFNSSS